MPVIVPLTSDRNLTPSSTAPGSETDGFAGVAVPGHTLHGQLGPAAVVNDHVTSAARALPDTSFTPAAPPFTVAV